MKTGDDFVAVIAQEETEQSENEYSGSAEQLVSYD